MDFETTERLDPARALQDVNRSLPEGIRFLMIREIPRDAPHLASAARAARYRVHTGNGFDLEERLAAFRARGSVEVRREREGKVRVFRMEEALLDLRPLDGEAVGVTLSLSGNEGSIRPDEVLREIFGERARGMRTVREEILVEWNGRLVNPLLAAAAECCDSEVRIQWGTPKPTRLGRGLDAPTHADSRGTTPVDGDRAVP